MILKGPKVVILNFIIVDNSKIMITEKTQDHLDTTEEEMIHMIDLVAFTEAVKNTKKDIDEYKNFLKHKNM